MKISVIIPSYRPGKYIEQCLRSVESQSLDCAEYEVIVVLNGCCDPYLDMINGFVEANDYGNIIVVQTDEGGVSNARNIGINHASGQYLLFLDDDDWLSPTYLDALLAEAKDDVVVNGNFLMVDDEGQNASPHFLSSAYERLHASGRSEFGVFEGRSFMSSACGKLIPQKVIGSDRFNVCYRLGEDSLFMFAVSPRVRSLRIGPADAIYYIRCRNNSASRSKWPWSYRARLAVSLAAAYVAIYLRRPLRFHFLFFASRVVATLRKIFYRQYE